MAKKRNREMMMNDSSIIKHNARVHDTVSNKYDRIHSEIFNPLEQERLHQRLKQALAFIETTSQDKVALDYGCGSGNLTHHLIALDINVVSADVSNKFLRIVKKRFYATGKLDTLKINGKDLNGIGACVFDFVGVYSVLHHIPDYLRAIEEMVRVLKNGGVIYIDHEANETFWVATLKYKEFKRLVESNKRYILFDLVKYLKPMNYLNALRQIANPNYTSEGDIHTSHDDHIDWGSIKTLLMKNGCELMLEDDYLLYRQEYPVDIYEEYKNQCNDVHLIVARKRA